MGRSRFRRWYRARDHPFSRSLHPRHGGDGDAGKRAAGDGDLQRCGLVGGPQRAHRSAAHQRDDFRHRRAQGQEPRGAERMKKNAKGIGLAIIGAGRVGLFRGEVAARHPAVEWIGIAELNHNRGGDVAARIGADFVTTSHRELLARPEVNAVLISTDEHLHVDPILAAVERGLPMLIEKPLATDLAQSARVLEAITDAKLDAIVGYTQRFRRKWLAGKEKVRSGALGDVTMVTSRAFMNRLVAIDNYKRTDDPSTISPIVISGTHALDIVMWYLEGKTPVECYARSVDKVLGPLYQGIDATAGMIMCADGTLYHLNISWALPVTWPARSTAWKSASTAPTACSPSTTPIATWCSRSQNRRVKAMRRIKAGWSISSAPIRPATWRSANCAARCARRPIPGSTASRSACRPRLLPLQKRITG